MASSSAAVALRFWVPITCWRIELCPTSSPKLTPMGRWAKLRQKRRKRQGRASVRTFDDRGDALADEILGRRGLLNALNAVTVGINETGRQNQALGIQCPF